jgi:hypothetical protein
VSYGAVVDAQKRTCSLWLVDAGGLQHAFTELDDAQAFKDDWDAAHLVSDEATVRSVTFVASDMHKPRAGCWMIAVEIPSEILIGLIDRCVMLGLNPHRLVSGLVLNSFNQPDLASAKAATQTDRFEQSKRRPFTKWQQPVAAEGGV